MAEIKSAVASDGSIVKESDQADPTPKSESESEKESESSAPKAKQRKASTITTPTVPPEDGPTPGQSPITTKVSGPELDNRGVVVTKWDNPSADPNQRKHIGESPNGEGNDIA